MGYTMYLFKNVNNFSWFIAEWGKWNCVVACKISQFFFVQSNDRGIHTHMCIHTHSRTYDYTGLDKVCKDYEQICL